MLESVAFSSGVSKSSRMIPASAKAWSVGANTVNGPVPWSVATSPAWARAATNESWMPVAAAFAGISSAGSALTLSGRLEATSMVSIKKTTIFLINTRNLAEVIMECFFAKKLTFTEIRVNSSIPQTVSPQW